MGPSGAELLDLLSCSRILGFGRARKLLPFPTISESVLASKQTRHPSRVSPRTPFDPRTFVLSSTSRPPLIQVSGTITSTKQSSNRPAPLCIGTFSTAAVDHYRRLSIVLYSYIRSESGLGFPSHHASNGLQTAFRGRITHIDD